MTVAAFWWVNEVTVETILGQQGSRPKYDAPVSVACWLEDGNLLVRNSSGDEVVSSTRVHAALEYADLLKVGSHVTLPTGRVATVLGLERFDSGVLALGLDHLVANLT